MSKKADFKKQYDLSKKNKKAHKLGDRSEALKKIARGIGKQMNMK